MGVEKKNINEIVSRIAANLFVKSKSGEELSSKIDRLRDEIKKVIESEHTIVGKFRELVGSFEEIIPEEQQRYLAALKALSTTANLSRKEIVKAIDGQLAELTILEKGLMPGLPGWRDEFKVMEARSREIKDAIAKLRKRIERLENEEQDILNGMATREKDMVLAETAVRDLFADIREEITDIKDKIGEFTAERAASQPVPPKDSVNSDIPGNEKGSGEQKSGTSDASVPPDAEREKICPMCGSRMNLHRQENKWLCYVCAYEELEKDEVWGKGDEKSEQTNAPVLPPASKPRSGPSPLRAVHLGSLSSSDYQESEKESSPSLSQPSGKKKDCPVCREKMDWYESEKAWRCSFCDYERSI